MKADIKAQWTAALRSGEFVQGFSALNTNGQYCCLGVLSELAYQAGVVSKTDDGCGYYGYGAPDCPSFAHLPKEVMEWSGVTSERGAYGNTSLVIDNDEGASFPDIARIIELNF